jgi:hypothetical protein
MQYNYMDTDYQAGVDGLRYAAESGEGAGAALMQGDGGIQRARRDHNHGGGGVRETLILTALEFGVESEIIYNI